MVLCWEVIRSKVVILLMEKILHRGNITVFTGFHTSQVVSRISSMHYVELMTIEEYCLNASSWLVIVVNALRFLRSMPASWERICHHPHRVSLKMHSVFCHLGGKTDGRNPAWRNHPS